MIIFFIFISFAFFQPQLADGVLAVVGNQTVLLSDVKDEADLISREKKRLVLLENKIESESDTISEVFNKKYPATFVVFWASRLTLVPLNDASCMLWAPSAVERVAGSLAHKNPTLFSLIPSRSRRGALLARPKLLAAPANVVADFATGRA